MPCAIWSSRSAGSELFSALDFAFSLLDKASGGKSYTVKTREGLVCLSGKEIVSRGKQEPLRAIYSLSSGEVVRSVSIRGTFEEAVAPLPDDP
jgi:hypothetical protein